MAAYYTDDYAPYAVLTLLANSGHVREAARVMLAGSRELRHDAELLARTSAAVDVRGDTLFLAAVKRRDRGRMAELLRACNTPAARLELLEARDARGGTALMRAPDGDVARDLLAAGASLSAKVDAGVPPAPHHAYDERDVFWAVAARAGGSRPGVLAALLAALPSDEARRERATRPYDRHGDTLLMLVHTAEEARALLAAGADVHAQDSREHWDTIVWAINASHHEVLRVLLTSLAPDECVEVLTRHHLPLRFTLLMFAATSSPDTVRVLLEAGAELNAQDHENHDIFWHAAGSASAGVFALLLDELGDPPSSRARRAAVLARPDLVPLLAGEWWRRWCAGVRQPMSAVALGNAKAVRACRKQPAVAINYELEI